MGVSVLRLTDSIRPLFFCWIIFCFYVSSSAFIFIGSLHDFCILSSVTSRGAFDAPMKSTVCRHYTCLTHCLFIHSHTLLRSNTVNVSITGSLLVNSFFSCLIVCIISNALRLESTCLHTACYCCMRSPSYIC